MIRRYVYGYCHFSSVHLLSIQHSSLLAFFSGFLDFDGRRCDSGTVPGGYLHMAFFASIVFAFAGLALLHRALSLRIALPLLLTASFCIILHFGPRTPRNGVRTYLSGTWDGWIPRLGHGRWQGQKGMSGYGTQGLQRGWVMRALTGLRRRWSVYGFYDNEWGNE